VEGEFPQEGEFILAKEPEAVGNLIAEFLARSGYAKRLQKQAAVMVWPEIAGPKIAEETQAFKIDGDSLVVKVARAAWRQQLTFLKAELLANLNSRLGEGIIKDIRFI